MARAFYAWPVLLLVLPGCATYERQPLALDEHVEAWGRRSLESESVRHYARQLAGAEGESSGAAFDASDGLTLTEAQAVALVFNPDLRLARSQAGVPLATAREAGWWPDPAFEAEVLRFTSRGTPTRFRFQKPAFEGVNTGVLGASGFDPAGLEVTPPGFRRVPGDYEDDPWEIGASLAFTIPLSGRLAVERDWSWAEFDAVWRQVLVQEWNLLTRLRQGWRAWSAAHERLRLTREYLDRLDEVARMAERLSATGELASAEARVLRIGVARQQAALSTLEFDARQQRLELLGLLGLAPQSDAVLVPDLVPAAEPDGRSGGIPGDSASRTALLLQRHPRLRAAVAEYEAAEQRLRLEVRRQYPDLELGPGFGWEDGISRIGLGFGFTLPLWNHNRQAVAEALAGRDAARVQAETMAERVLEELAQTEVRLAAAIAQRRMLDEQVAPLVDRQVDETRRLLELGEIDILVLREALAGALETKLEFVDATLAEAQAADALHQMLAPQYLTPRPEAEEDTR